MDLKFAQNLINHTFNHPFNEKKFNLFILNLLNEKNNINQIQWQNNENLQSSLKKNIKEFKILTNYVNQYDEKILVVLSKLKSSKVVEQSRYVQRNFAKSILNDYNADGCLIAFFSENHDDWRFSFIKLEYKRTINEKDKIKVVKNLSPLKRYSYLVGKNEPNRTAKLQLTPLIINNKKPSINDIERAFSVEKVTKEFFDEYKRLCFKISDELKNLRLKEKNIDNDFKNLFIKEIDFAKKFMGQIVFLYFIQKKGWIGIKRDSDGRFQKWGDGPKNFIRRLFNKEYCNYDNFFNDILEDLFYVGLSVDLPDNFYSKLKCKVPFLNGGLFEPINDYNWKETDITIKDDTIKEILDVFDTFNFTINEEDPLEKEVAIDPETLGKVFENLLDENLQRGHGVFYTPRNIVDYMSLSSLASYISCNLSLENKNLDLKKIINEIYLIEIDSNQSLSGLKENSALSFLVRCGM